MGEKTKRPALVWVISCFYFVGVPGILLSLYYLLSPSALTALAPEQRTYFESLSAFDIGAMIAGMLCNLAGAVSLLRLKRQAVYFLLAAWLLGLCQFVWQTLTKDYLNLMSHNAPGLLGALTGEVLSVAILIYVYRLKQKQVLR